VKRKLDRACSMIHYADAKQALERLHLELMHLNPSAARSLEEGLEETLTVHRLHTPSQIRRTLSSTNVIESAFSAGTPPWHYEPSRRATARRGPNVREKRGICRPASARPGEGT
jgi:putative transposase